MMRETLDETKLNVLPPPDDSFGTLDHRNTPAKISGPGRPSTGQTQINIKLSKECRAGFLATCARVKKERKLTRGEVLADMLEVYLATHAAPAPKTIKSAAPKPPPRDVSDDRTEHRDIFFQPGLVEMLERHCGDQTISEFVQNLIEAGFSARELKAQNDELRAKLTAAQAAA